MESLRYPIGTFQFPADVTERNREEWIDQIATLPVRVKETVKGLTEEQLQSPYREGGWTVKQVVHHLADSNLNAYIRFKFALTEETPTIKPFDEASWAELADTKLSVDVSVQLMEGLHARWEALLRNMKPEDFSKTFVHPVNGVQSLDYALGLYAWHGNHHLAQISSLKERMGW
jgi:uncharacterized damage-inducible protein DinB